MPLPLDTQYIVAESINPVGGQAYQIYAPRDSQIPRAPILDKPTECREFAYDYCHALNEARRKRYFKPANTEVA